MNRFIITGATGNTGFLVLERLLKQSRSIPILALVRSSSDTAALKSLGVTFHECNLEQPSTYVNQLHPEDVLIETANLRLFQWLEPVLKSVGIKRAFCVTTTAVFSKYHSYSALYREIESNMKQSTVKVTILRPSMIYGNERDHNMHKLLRVLHRTPIFPVFGDGKALMQPVHVEDLADGIVAAVLKDSEGDFNLAGLEPISYNLLLKTAAFALGKKIFYPHIPHIPVAKIVSFAEKIPKFPIKYEQIIRLQEDKSFDISESVKKLNYAPKNFSLGINQEVLRLRKLNLL
jgi:nucleoside-diphosphate-sugar epimerase